MKDISGGEEKGTPEIHDCCIIVGIKTRAMPVLYSVIYLRIDIGLMRIGANGNGGKKKKKQAENLKVTGWSLFDLKNNKLIYCWFSQ